MFRFAATMIVVLGMAAGAHAQDPTKTIPESYKVVLDNDYVRVVRVHYDAGAKLPAHTHPSGTTAYVYLNDSEGVVFRHVAGMSTVINRPPVKAGGIRLSSGMEEHHEVENTSASPSDFLRIQLKTIKPGSIARQRIAPAATRADTSVDVAYRSEHFVIQRFSVGPGKTIPGGTISGQPRTEPSLWVSIPSGETRWADDVPASFALPNTGTAPIDVLRFIFLKK